MNFLSLDVGTTACKCQLFSEQGEILGYLMKEYPLKEEEGVPCVDIAAICENVFGMVGAAKAWGSIDSICISTFGETFVALDEEDNVLFAPMLYTDRRGDEEAQEISDLFGNAYAFRVTGAVPHSMYSVSKLLWVKKHRPELYAKIGKVLLICDYLGYLLTGERVIDYSLAARTGVFDINELRFSEEMCKKLGIDADWFSRPARAGSIVGKVKNKELSLENCTLVLGAHDQVCTALGAGIVEEDRAVDGMGTVECITAVYRGAKGDPEMGELGYPCVPYAVEGLYCTYIVNYASGSIVNWLRRDIMHGYKGEEEKQFAYLEKGMKEDPTNLFVLPYFAGATIPYRDINAKGAVVGLTTSTTDSELYKAVMEGLSMEMRLETAVAERFGIRVKSAVATGGGANSKKWLQLKAEIQGIPYATLRSSEGGLCGCAVLSSVAMGKKSFREAADIFVQVKERFPAVREGRYEEKYSKYQKLYHSLKEFF